MRHKQPFALGHTLLWVACLYLFSGLLFAQSVHPPTPPPFRAYQALHAPTWLRFGLEQRTRFEHLQNDFHVHANDHSTALSLRTLLSAELQFAPVRIAAELQDARAYATIGTPLNHTIVNPIELLQAHLILERTDLFTKGDTGKLTLGRLSMDIGSRRLVARNDFRNTINAFTGIDLQWSSPKHHIFRGFAVLPIMRRPSDPVALAENKIEFDQENIHTIFWGIFFGSAPLFAGLQLESYLFGLHEEDSSDAPTANRHLFTPGMRVFLPPAPGKLDFQAELMLQLGTFLGHQIEARLRWHVLPKNLSLELGSAYLIRGSFAVNAPGAKNASPLFGYLQVTGTI